MLAEEREEPNRRRVGKIWHMMTQQLMRDVREMHVKEHVGKAYHRRSSEHSWINEMQDTQLDEIPHARNPSHYNAQWVHRWDVFPHAPT
jgi:hypothetical protein